MVKKYIYIYMWADYYYYHVAVFIVINLLSVYDTVEFLFVRVRFRVYGIKYKLQGKNWVFEAVAAPTALRHIIHLI